MKKPSNSLLGRSPRSRPLGPPDKGVAEVAAVLAGEAFQNDAALAGEARKNERMKAVRADDRTTRAAPANPKHHDGGHDHAPRRAGPAGDDAWTPLIDIRVVIESIIGLRHLIALLTLAGLALGVVIAMGIPKYYYSTVELLVDPRDLKISERELTPSTLPYDASLAIVENQTRIVTSRRVIETAIEKLNLQDDGEFNGRGLGAPSPVKFLLDLVSGKDADDPARTKEVAVENLYKAISVSREPKTFMLNLTVRSEVPDKAALIANTLAEVYLQTQQDIQTGAAQRASGEIGGRLEALRGEVEDAERAVEAYRSENELFDANGKLISDDEISLISTQLTQARQRVSELKARADSARELTVDQVLSDALPEGATSNLIAELRRGYANKVQQRDALAQKLGAQHPQLQTAEAEVASAARAIETELRRLSQSAQIDLQRAIKTEQDLASGQARQKSRQSDISEKLVRLRELEREAGARRAVYENFLLRARETGEQAGISTANTTIVSKAVPAIRSYGSSRKLVAIGGAFAGFMLGFALGVLRGIWRCIRAEGTPRRPAQNRPVPARAEMDAPAMPAPTDPAPALSAAPPQPAREEQDPMYQPYPPQHPAYAPAYPAQTQHAVAPQAYAPQMHVPQAYAPQMPMMQPVMPQMMPQMMQPQPYAPAFMPQPQPYAPAYGMPQAHPMMPQVYPAMPQAYAMPQPVYAPAPQPAPVMQQPVFQPAPQAAPQAAPADTSGYDEIRGRLRALRDGISLLNDGRDRLNAIGG